MYIPPSQTNTFQAVVATDGTQTYVIFTYNCSDLEWDRTNSFAAADCSFIGCYAGGNFNNYLSETDSHGLQIDRRTANISRASCSSEVTSWNNLLFFLTYQGKSINHIYKAAQAFLCMYIPNKFSMNLIYRYCQCDCEGTANQCTTWRLSHYAILYQCIHSTRYHNRLLVFPAVSMWWSYHILHFHLQ